MKYVIVSGGVLSGLGKGVTASSIGVLLKSAGLRTTSIKIDPSVRIDAQLELTRDIAFVRTNGTLCTFTAGFNYSLSDKWALNVGTSYTPLDVVRLTPAGGDDNLWNFRMGISFNTN